MNNNNNRRFIGSMLDCSRNAVMTVEAIKKWIDITSDLGYNMLMLYTEDTYEIKNQPYFGYLRGRYTAEEIKEIDKYAKSKNTELIPCIQTLAHLNQITRWPAYKDHIDQRDILLLGDEEVYKLIEDMFDTVCECYSSKYIHVGMDEAVGLGHGKYYSLHGGCNIGDMFIEHIVKVAEIAKKHDKKILIWGDMFHSLLGPGKHENLPDDFDRTLVEKLPDNVEIVCWEYNSTSEDYYDGRIKSHNKIREGSWFAGAFRSWWGFAPHNKYSISANKAVVSACTKNGVKDFLFTVWGNDGAECPKFSLLPCMFYTSELLKGNTDEELVKKKFYEKYKIDFDSFMLLDLPYSPNGLDEGLYNSDKYLLYNDVFMGIMDSTLTGNEKAGFGKCAEELHALESNAEWGYLFKTSAALCDVLAVKCDLGVRTRAAYKNKDKSKLKELLSDYDALVLKLELFYEAFRDQWYTENKGQGFEVQDVRLGGLIQRVKHCKKMLYDYISGETDKIYELEEVMLDYNGGGTDFQNKPVMEQLWANIFTANLPIHFV